MSTTSLSLRQQLRQVIWLGRRAARRDSASGFSLGPLTNRILSVVRQHDGQKCVELNRWIEPAERWGLYAGGAALGPLRVGLVGWLRGAWTASPVSVWCPPHGTMAEVAARGQGWARTTRGRGSGRRHENCGGSVALEWGSSRKPRHEPDLLQPPSPAIGARWMSMPVRRSRVACTDSGSRRSGAGWPSSARQRARRSARQRLASSP